MSEQPGTRTSQIPQLCAKELPQQLLLNEYKKKWACKGSKEELVMLIFKGEVPQLFLL